MLSCNSLFFIPLLLLLCGPYTLPPLSYFHGPNTPEPPPPPPPPFSRIISSKIYYWRVQYTFGPSINTFRFVPQLSSNLKASMDVWMNVLDPPVLERIQIPLLTFIVNDSSPSLLSLPPSTTPLSVFTQATTPSPTLPLSAPPLLPLISCISSHSSPLSSYSSPLSPFLLPLPLSHIHIRCGADREVEDGGWEEVIYRHGRRSRCECTSWRKKGQRWSRLSLGRRHCRGIDVVVSNVVTDASLGVEVRVAEDIEEEERRELRESDTEVIVVEDGEEGKGWEGVRE